MHCQLQFRRTTAGSLRLGVSALAMLCGFGIAVAQTADTPWQEPIDVAFTARSDGSTQRYVVMLPKGIDTTGPVDLLVAGRDRRSACLFC